MNQRWQGWRWLLAVLAVAMLPRIAYLGWQAHTGAIRWEDGAHQEYLRAASGLTRNGAMGDCYSFTGNVFAYAARSPILPLLLAGFQRLGLDPILWGKLAAGLAGVIGVALSGVFCGVMAERYDPRLSQPAAAFGMLFAGFSPFGIYLSAKLLTEIWLYASSLISLLLVELALRRTTGGKPDRIAWLLAGVALGFGTLIKESGAFVLAGAVLWVIFRLRIRRAAGPLACLLLAAALTNLPWPLRNLIRTGHFEPLTSLSGVNLFIAFNDFADGGADQNFLPLEVTADCRDEFAVCAVYREHALAWIKAHPGRALALIPAKLWRFFRPFPDPVDAHRVQIWFAGCYWLLVYVCAIGVWLLPASPDARRELAGFLLPFMIIFCVVHGIFPGLARYRYVLEPMLLVAAAICLARMASFTAALLSRQPALSSSGSS